MNSIVAEFIGTFIMMSLGLGVVANLNLRNTYANNEGSKWMLLTSAWGFAVFFGVIVAGQFSGAHLNPCCNSWVWQMSNKFAWSLVPSYIFTQILRMLFLPPCYCCICFLYRSHIKATAK